ncbi:MAG: NAD(P)/FAD-dependent oxidoreductase [Acutalibacteraceae bacterium]
MKTAIIGGGASGLACAVSIMKKAKENGLNCDVTVFEKNSRVGKKLLSTGNGRCNLTNIDACADDYFDAKEFVMPAFEKFPPESTVDFFASLGIFTRTDSQGRVYPLSNQASGVLDAFRFACERFGVKIRCDSEVHNIKKTKKGFIINDNEEFDNIVIAVGSPSAVKGFNGYKLISSLGHKITAVSPSLVKLTTTQSETKQLKGIRAVCRLNLFIDGKPVHSEYGELLFSDFVLSGIAAMQLSSYVSRHFQNSKNNPVVYVDFVPDYDFSTLLNLLFEVCKNCKTTSAENLLSGFMPKKIGMVILKKSQISLSLPMNEISSKQLKTAASFCKKYPFEINGTKSFDDSQVTAGGADREMFDPKTLMSLKIPGLYCCGEILDVDGPCGGYNLQWAWSSARLCAESILTGENRNDKNK